MDYVEHMRRAETSGHLRSLAYRVTGWCRELSEMLQYNAPGHKQGLLVLQDGEYRSDMELMRQLMTWRGYEATVLMPEESSRPRIFSEIERLARRSSRNSQTLIYYIGHGEQNNRGAVGINANYKYNGRIVMKTKMGPRLLFRKVGRIRGRKAVVIDSCHSGAFIDFLEKQRREAEPLITDYVALAPTTRDGSAVSILWDVPDRSPLKGEQASNLTAWLYGALSISGTEKSINLASEPLVEHYPPIGGFVEDWKSEGGDLEGIVFRLQRSADTSYIF